MIDADRYHHTGRTYVNISRAPGFLDSSHPGADTPGYVYAAASGFVLRTTP